MEPKRITTLNVSGKNGVSVERWKYDRVRAAILDVLAERGEVPFQPDLARLVEPRLGADWQGNTSWYTTSVKLDLEARGEIERVPGRTPQRLRLTKR
jgi:hypothetical protein